MPGPLPGLSRVLAAVRVVVGPVRAGLAEVEYPLVSDVIAEEKDAMAFPPVVQETSLVSVAVALLHHTVPAWLIFLERSFVHVFAGLHRLYPKQFLAVFYFSVEFVFIAVLLFFIWNDICYF